MIQEDIKKEENTNSFDLITDPRLVKGLNRLKIQELTAIQKECFKPALEGKNIIGCSPTGSGKTFAYLLPIIQKNHSEQPISKELYAVIIVPSKELSIQICSSINQLSNHSGIPVTAAALFGGVNKNRQLETLKSKPNIVVGTYARIYELIKEKKLPAYQVKTLIIDEADQMLKPEHFDGILALRKCLMRDVQIMLFSASIKQNVEKLSSELSLYPFVKIFTNEKLTIPGNIHHYYFVTEKRDQIEEARKVLKATDSHHCMIFVNSKYDAEEITQKLIYHNYSVAGLTSNMSSNERRQLIDSFKQGKFDCIICSDLAARGLHFDHVDTIISIGLPDQNNDYLHRAGRCGRNGHEGISIAIITPKEEFKIKNLQKTFAINMLPKKLYQGKIVRK